MQYTNNQVCTAQNTVSLDAKVQDVVNAINANTIVPYGDFGGPNVYYFQTFDNGLGNLAYTIFDRHTNLGLASFMVRYGAAATIRQVIMQPFPRSQIDLQFLILPQIPTASFTNGTVIP